MAVVRSLLSVRFAVVNRIYRNRCLRCIDKISCPVADSQVIWFHLKIERAVKAEK